MGGELVRCRSEFRYAETPRELFWDGRWIEIRSVLAEQRVPQGHTFRVLTQEETVFELLFDELKNEWTIHET